MHSNYVVVLALLSSYVNGLPLNINLGAYSPALVVGDGEYQMEGAAVPGGAANGAATAPAAAVAVAQPQQANGAAAIQAAPADQSTQITALQGMGKEIAPRVVPRQDHYREERYRGFIAALNYAIGALMKSPEIQLGTGEGGSGVSITQKAGGVTTGAKATVIAAREIIAREEFASPKMRMTVTRMFVRGGPAPARLERSADDSTPLEKRAPSPVPGPSQGLDGVNLNMAEGQVAELTHICPDASC